MLKWRRHPSGLALVCRINTESSPQLARRERLSEDRCADVEGLSTGNRPYHDRFEPGIPDQAQGHRERIAVIAGEGNRNPLSGPVRLASKFVVTNRIEGAEKAGPWQKLGRCRARPLGARRARRSSLGS